MKFNTSVTLTTVSTVTLITDCNKHVQTNTMEVICNIFSDNLFATQHRFISR